MNFAKRVAILTAGKDVPRTPEEKTLMYAYHSAMDGQSLVKTYLGIDEATLIGDNLHCFVLGFSAGQATRKFTLNQRKNISTKSLN
jgi:hypothetical protein